MNIGRSASPAPRSTSCTAPGRFLALTRTWRINSSYQIDFIHRAPPVLSNVEGLAVSSALSGVHEYASSLTPCRRALWRTQSGITLFLTANWYQGPENQNLSFSFSPQPSVFLLLSSPLRLNFPPRTANPPQMLPTASAPDRRKSRNGESGAKRGSRTTAVAKNGHETTR